MVEGEAVAEAIDTVDGPWMSWVELVMDGLDKLWVDKLAAWAISPVDND